MKTVPQTAERAHAVAQAAAQWRDPASDVRARAREALADGPWPPAVVERALDNALWDLDESRAHELCSGAFLERAHDRARLEQRASTLVFLPGNVIGPALQSAFCAAVAGVRTILKASSAERHLADIAGSQFERFEPIAGLVESRHFRGGDRAAEEAALEGIDAIVAFGQDDTIEQIRARAGDRTLVAYGESYSIAYVDADADLGDAATSAARDVCLFDQRGCMSPQTIYVAGDPGRALRFTHALATAMRSATETLPRARLEEDEAALVSDFVRRLKATAVAPMPHGLDTLLPGPTRGGVPEFVVALEPFGRPTCAGFGRIVVVEHAPGARDVTTQLKYYGRAVETIGVSPGTSERERSALSLSGARRLCALGAMQRPAFGYRPRVTDFR